MTSGRVSRSLIMTRKLVVKSSELGNLCLPVAIGFISLVRSKNTAARSIYCFTSTSGHSVVKHCQFTT